MKIHDVPITVFTEDDLSAIATKVGTLLMLYSYTLVMCTELWVKSSYARAMIDLRADTETAKMFKLQVDWPPNGCILKEACLGCYEEHPNHKTRFSWNPNWLEVLNGLQTKEDGHDTKENKGYTGGTGAENSSLNKQRKKSYGEDPYDDANFNTLILTDAVIVRLQQGVLQLPTQNT
ncbi:hypothetical protein Tco_1163230 [Tanacetum coccineum]